MNYKVSVPLPGPLGEGRIEFDKLDDFAAGVTVSALWEPTERTRVGFLWTQEVDMNLTGDILNNRGRSANITTRVPFVQSIRTSLLHELTPKLWLAASFRWEDWSAFEKQFVSIEGFTSQINRGWGDTFGGAIGGRWQFAERWALLSGVGFDSSPVGRSDRTADIPSTARSASASAPSTPGATRPSSAATSATPTSGRPRSAARRCAGTMTATSSSPSASTSTGAGSPGRGGARSRPRKAPCRAARGSG